MVVHVSLQAGENGDEGPSDISYSDNQAYSSAESQDIAEQQKCLKAAANKQPVESADTSLNSGKGNLTTLDVPHKKSELARSGSLLIYYSCIYTYIISLFFVDPHLCCFACFRVKRCM